MTGTFKKLEANEGARFANSVAVPKAAPMEPGSAKATQDPWLLGVPGDGWLGGSGRLRRSAT